MSEQPQGPGWWVASDGRWYPPPDDAHGGVHPMPAPDPTSYAAPHLPPVPPAGREWNTPLPVGAAIPVRPARRWPAWALAVLVLILVVAGVLVALAVTGAG